MTPEEKIIHILKNNHVEYIFSVPCAKFRNLLTLCSQNFKHFPLTREEEGMGIATGIYLAGSNRSALLIQSGGIGNSINALMSLVILHKIPLPILISWRGIYKEKINAQKSMGQHLTQIFDALDIPFIEIHDETRIDEIENALQLSFKQEIPFGIFLSPKVWEESELKLPELEFPPRERTSEIHIKKIVKNPSMTRYEILQGLQSFLTGKIIISNIGIPSKELYAICDQASNFYMTGSFGLVSLIGLGIAWKIPDEIIVLDGDGSILTNPNALCTIGQVGPKNLTILAIDNGTHGSTGNQITHAYKSIDLEVLAQSFGIQETDNAYTPEDVIRAHKSLKSGPKFIQIYTKPFNANVATIPLTPIQIRNQFMNFIKETYPSIVFHKIR